MGVEQKISQDQAHFTEARACYRKREAVGGTGLAGKQLEPDEEAGHKRSKRQKPKILRNRHLGWRLFDFTQDGVGEAVSDLDRKPCCPPNRSGRQRRGQVFGDRQD
jgi:hypothetical protein